MREDMREEMSGRPMGSQQTLSTSDLAEAASASRATQRSEPPLDTFQRDSPIITPAPDNNAAAPAMPVQSTGQNGAEQTPLFSSDEAARLRSQWDGIQVGFVDEPRHAVEQADQLVAETMKRLAEIFADQRKSMEQQWESGDRVSTEDLRIALRSYRSFFGRLLAM